ncbi:hypothetical protein ES703_66456 [subsurface metagenome]
MSLRTQWPYAAKAIVQHVWLVDLLYVWVTFKFSMLTTSDPLAEPIVHDVMPPLNLWLCEVDGVPKAITVSAWQDAWTLLLTVPDVLGLPSFVTLGYDGPNEDLQTTWNKYWEPWGPILSNPVPYGWKGRLVFNSLTHSAAGPTDDLDVSIVNIIFIDCSANDVVIGGFINGVEGQVLHIVKLCAAEFDATLEHDEPHAFQKIFLHAGLDETLRGEYGGWILVCDGTSWFDTSHSKHV